MQKYVTESYLTHKTVTNNGQAPKVYSTNHHTPIVSREMWDEVRRMMDLQDVNQRKRKAQKNGNKKQSATMPFGNLYCGLCGEHMDKFGYNNAVVSYHDERSNDFDAETEEERYFYYHSVLRCPNKIQKTGRKDGNRPHGDCESDTLHDFSLQQSFMEMLYRLKRDYEQNGEQSEVVTAFQTAIEKEKAGNSEYRYMVEKADALKGEIEILQKEQRELSAKLMTAQHDEEESREEELGLAFTISEDSNDASDVLYAEDCDESPVMVYSRLLTDVENRLEERQNQLEELENSGGAVIAMTKNFKLFMNCLTALPEENAAGMKLNVNTLDCQGSFLMNVDGTAITGRKHNLKTGRFHFTTERIESSPDILNFEKRIYLAFIEKGKVLGDNIVFKTIFGAEFTAHYVTRDLAAFLGFRRINDDGSLEILTERCRVCGTTISYNRRKRKTKSTDTVG